MTLARDKASMADVLLLLRERASKYARRPTPEQLAASLTCERYPFCGPAISRFRTLRQDARVAAARRALLGGA